LQVTFYPVFLLVVTMTRNIAGDFPLIQALDTFLLPMKC